MDRPHDEPEDARHSSDQARAMDALRRALADELSEREGEGGGPEGGGEEGV
jgi:hypothetical protein